MADPFLGEVRMFAGNFAPQGWLTCDGQLVSIAENDALYTLLGTTFGGDGVITFGLPDLRGRTPIHMGNGIGLTPRELGQMIGDETVTLTASQLPSHYHPVHANGAAGTLSDPTNAVWAEASTSEKQYSDNPTNVAMSLACTQSMGGGLAHDNLMPFQVMTFIIATAGVYPSPPQN